MKKFSNSIFYLNLALCCFLTYFYLNSHLKSTNFLVFSNISYLQLTSLTFLLFIPAFLYAEKKKNLSFILFLLFSTTWLGDSYSRFLVHVTCLFFLFQSRKKFKLNSYFYIYFGISSLYFSSLIRSIKIDTDHQLLIDLFYYFDLKTFIPNFLDIISYSKWNIINFIEISVLSFMPLALGSIYSSQDIIKQFKNSIFYLTIPISALAILQLFYNIQIFELKLNEFWDMQGRISSISSDPNAFGIISSLFIAFLFLFHKKDDGIKFVLYSLLILFCSTFSGSRASLLLLFSVFALNFGFYYKEFSFKKHLTKIILSFAATLIILYIVRPPSIDRLLYSFNVDSFKSSFESRFIYFKIAKEVIIDNPVAGIGYGRFFFENQKYAKLANIELNNWSDNANNYYLEIFSEGGVLSFIILCLLLYTTLKIINKVEIFEKGFRIIFFAFLIALFFGPHVHFIEIKLFLLILGSMLASSLSSSNNFPKNKVLFYLPLFSILLQILIPKNYLFDQNFGLHKNESLEKGINKFWTGSKGEICVDNLKEKHVLIISNLNPSSPISLKINEGKFNFRLEPNQSSKLEFSNEINKLQFNLDSTWQPSKVVKNRDTRILGLLFTWESQNSCI